MYLTREEPKVRRTFTLVMEGGEKYEIIKKIKSNLSNNGVKGCVRLIKTTRDRKVSIENKKTVDAMGEISEAI